ncbi:ABC transporter permease [Fulvivirga lutea]|uniref:ABC transporter permease n=1 Tax=Fulvivirga lutea TaxID=2810512 RepID=A0A975A0Z5_9BACT|nr:ABC transporter permease [Fulvivirga lutea]QSE97331.1 ABC transporter permease [Fulvivirga lutea]
MIRNYLVTSFRNLNRHWKLTIINILGLSVGVASFLIIITHAYRELSYDHFHKDFENTYRVSMLFTPEGRKPYHTPATFSAVGPGLTEDMPEVTKFCRIIPMGFGDGGFVQYKSNIQTFKHIHYVDSSYFDLFSFHMLKGNSKTALIDVHTAVISDEVAQVYFPEEDPIDKTISINSIDGITEYTITGVFEKRNDTHLPADILVSYSSLVNLIGQEHAYAWNWFDYITYIQVDPSADIESLTSRFPAFIDKHGGERRGSKMVNFELQPLADIHLHSNINQEMTANGDYDTILFLIIVAVVILITAWVNYINLYISQASERIKEVGIRKTLGSKKSQLVVQFFLESALVNLISIVLSIVLLWMAIPMFNELANAQLVFTNIITNDFILFVCALWVFCTLITGFYPALVISRFGTIASLKQKGGNTTTGRLRKALVTAQFAASAGLVSWTLIVYGQFSFMNEQDLGIDTSQTLIVEASDLFQNPDDHKRKLTLFKNQLIASGYASKAAFTSDVPGKQVGWRGGTARIGEDDERSNSAVCFKMVVGKDYFPMLQSKLVAGRYFLNEADSNRVIINSKALELYEFNNAEAALGNRVQFMGMGEFEIIGVVDNYFQESLKEDFKPTAYFNISTELSDMMIRMESTNYQQNIAGIESIFKQTFPELPFSYYWLDSQLNRRHDAEGVFFEVFKVFTYLTLFISFLGLVSLSFFMVEKRLKEIGIRKVLGSSVLSIMKLIFKDILVLVAIGNLIAIPFVIYFGKDWLSGFAFHIEFNSFILLFTLSLTVFFAAASTVYHVIRAAMLNPVTVLRNE